MKSEWFKEWFESDEYLKVYNHRNTDDAEKLTTTLLGKIGLNRNSLILDAACGNGRYSVLLAKKGFKVVGFDLSAKLLTIARNNIKKESCNILLFRADVREVCLKTEFDLILLAFTSFGYFESDDENFKFINSSYKLLKPKGYFVLDFLNEKYLRNNLVPFSEREFENLKIREERKIEKDRVIKKIIIENNRAKREYYEKVKLYDKDFIINRMELIGYEIVDIFGDYNGSEFIPERSERLIIIGRK